MDLSLKKIAIFGMGRSGLSALKLLAKIDAEVYAINQGEPENWKEFEHVSQLIPRERMFNQDAASSIFSQVDIIVLSPGIPQTHPALEKAVKKEVAIWSEIELAYLFFDHRAPIIGVTGTNGKTTTVSLMGEVLRCAGHKVFVGGNIGIPFCEYILEEQGADYVVLELSSFQLESMHTFRPNIAVLLNVFPNHGERYQGVEDYADAKFHITDYMTENDILIYDRSNSLISDWADGLDISVIPIDTHEKIKVRQEIEAVFDLQQFKLKGQHNLTNLLFVIKTMEALGVEEDGVQMAINTFAGVDFRVQYIASNDLFAAYNDGKSTNWDAVKTAVKAMDGSDRPVYLILGGQRRGRGDTLIPHLQDLSAVSKILLIGETTDQFANELAGHIDYQRCYDLATAVDYARETQFDGILLFSPGLPSFDQYANYVKRGEHFTSLIKNA